MLRRGHMAKAKFFVKMNRSGGLRVRFQIEPACELGSGQLDGEHEQLAADAMSASRFGDRHLGQFELAGFHGDQSATADDNAVNLGQADFSPSRKDLASGTVEHLAITGLDFKVVADPRLVQRFEGLLIAGLKPACRLAESLRYRLPWIRVKAPAAIRPISCYE
jgi:hypothetical protein